VASHSQAFLSTRELKGAVSGSLRIRYDTIEEFNADSKAECVQLNLAHVARKYRKEETKTNISAHLVQYRFKIREKC